MRRLAICVSLLVGFGGGMVWAQGFSYDPNDVIDVTRGGGALTESYGNDGNCSHEWSGPTPWWLVVPLLTNGPNYATGVFAAVRTCASTSSAECGVTEADASAAIQHGYAGSALTKTLAFHSSGVSAIHAFGALGGYHKLPDGRDCWTFTNAAFASGSRSAAVSVPFTVTTPGYVLVQASMATKTVASGSSSHNAGWEVDGVAGLGQDLGIDPNQTQVQWTSGTRSFAVGAGAYRFNASCDIQNSTGMIYGASLSPSQFDRVIVTLRWGGNRSTLFFQSGDVDGDYYVGSTDLARVLAKFGLCIDAGLPEEDGDPTYDPTLFDPEADLNGDGCINTTDLALVLANYGRTL